jgi:hypothetical protein
VALINPLHECLNGRVEFISRKKLTGIKLATAPGISEFFLKKQTNLIRWALGGGGSIGPGANFKTTK